MRIVHVTPFYHPVIGGVEEVARRIAEYATSKGHDAYVVTYNRLRWDGKDSLPEDETINGVHIRRIKSNFTWNHGTYSSELPKVLRELRPDLVHVHGWRHPHVFQVAKLRDELGFKAVLHSHAPFHKLSQLGTITWLYHRAVDLLMKKAFERYDNLIALTPHEENILVEKLGVQGDKVAVVPNGIDDELVDSAQNAAEMGPVVLYLGRVSRSKNVDLLVKALRYVRERIANAELVVAGPDEGLVGKLRSYAQKFGVNFHYCGTVSESEKYKLYQECAVFAHPALYEPLGITLLEAQAFGKPCVITGDGGQLYAAPVDKTSVYAKPNPKDFGEAVSLLLNDEELYRRLSVNAREWASQHTWSKILPKYNGVYELLCT